MTNYGVRCVSTNDWVTAAETAECVIALDAVGWTSQALDLLALVQRHRRDDGSYWTGYAFPETVTFPDRRDHLLHVGRDHPRRGRTHFHTTRPGSFVTKTCPRSSISPSRTARWGSRASASRASWRGEPEDFPPP